MPDTRDQIERDQDDFADRYAFDPFFAQITVLKELKGVIESDVDVALSTLNEKGGKIGAVVIVLQPGIKPTEPDAAGPEMQIRAAVQVITQALFNDGPDGTGMSNGRIAAKIRQLTHRFVNGGGTWSFAGTDPLPTDPGKISSVTYFTRRARDEEYPRCGTPLIDPDSGAVPQLITLTTGTDGAAIYYTTDGSYPSSANPNATRYTTPFNLAAACTLRCAAEKPDASFQQSNIAQAIFS